jgi:hypothetical protein
MSVKADSPIPEGKTPMPLLVVLCACAVSCTGTRKFQQPLTPGEREELRRLVPEKAEVAWSNGDKVGREPVLELRIRGPTTDWVQADTLQRRAVPEAALRSIEWRSSSLGAGRGFLIGGLIAGASLAIAGAASGSDPPCGPASDEGGFCFSATAGQKAAFAGVFGFLAGGLIGGLLGAIEASPMTVVFAPASANFGERHDPVRLKFGQPCDLTDDCERGLVCQAGRCLGTPWSPRE